MSAYIQSRGTTEAIAPWKMSQPLAKTIWWSPYIRSSIKEALTRLGLAAAIVEGPAFESSTLVGDWGRD